MATSTNRRLPKVSQYVRNVGKSVAYASIDAIKSNTPGIKEFMEENDDFFKELYAGVKDLKGTLRKSEKSIKDSNIYKAIDIGVKNTLDDLKTGNFYNNARVSENAESVMGIDDESLGLDFNYEVSFDDDDNDNNESRNTAILATSIRSASADVATAASRGTDLIVKSNKASTRLLSAYIERSTATIHSGLGAVYSSVDRVAQILNGPMMAHMENSRTFYETSTKLMQESNAMLKELLEMQRNVYQSKQNARNYKTSDLDNIMSGGLNLKAYFKHIADNVNEELEAFGIMDMGVNLPLMIAQAPLKFLLEGIAGGAMPKKLKQSLKNLDTGFSSIFSQLAASINKSAKTYSGNDLLDKLAQIMGISVKEKKSINTANYNRGPVPFDGITRKSIVEVIPGYLARIEAAITGRAERYFDSENGKWRSIKDIKTSFDSEYAYSVKRANYDLFSDSSRLIRSIKDPKAAKEMEDQIRKAAEIIYEDGGYFAPGIKRPGKNEKSSKRVTSGDAYKKYGFKSKQQFDIFINALSDDTIRGLASSNMRARESYAKRLEDYEANSGIYNVLFNDTIEKVDPKSKNTTSGIIMHKNILTLTQDNHGNSIFDYLRKILDAIGGRGGQRFDSGSNAPSGSSNSSNGRKRRNRNRSRKNKSSKDGDSGSEDSDPWSAAQAKIDEEDEKLRDRTEKKDATKKWIDEKLEKSKIGKFFVKMTGGVGDILAKPMKYATELLEKADKNMFYMMFGDNTLRDDDGNEVDSVFEYIIGKIKRSFEDLGKWIKIKLKTILDPLWDKVRPYYDKYGKPIVDELKNMGMVAGRRVIRGFDNVFVRPADAARARRDNRSSDYAAAAAFGDEAYNATGDRARTIIQKMYNRKMTKEEWKRYSSAIRKAKNGNVASADEVAGSATNADINDPGVIGENAFGTRFVTKRGLTMISPGEIIIPASTDPKELNKMLNAEKRDKNRILNSMPNYRDISLNAKGTVNTDRLRNTLYNIYSENKDPNKAAKVGAGSIAGGGLGLLLGNPLLGAMAGAGLSILDNSNTLKDIVFGQIGMDGKRSGGLISKKIQDIFSKALPDMTDFGIAGGVLGLFTPFGVLGGAAIGAGIGFLKNNDRFKKFLFGDETTEGLMSKETFDKFVSRAKEAAPNMLIGAGIGALTGPFGLLGNAAFGAGLGLLSTSNQFHTFVFGNKETGEQGLIGAFNEGFINPAKDKLLEFTADFKDYAQKHILEPMKDFWKPVNQMLINVIRGTSDRIGDAITGMFEKFLGLPINDFLQEKIFKPTSKILFGLLKAPYKIGRFALSAPFRVAGAVGNRIRTSQIRRGTAHDMSASERLAYRDQHFFRFNRFNAYRDKTRQEDELLANMSMEDLESVFSNARAGLDSFKKIQRSAGAAHDDVAHSISGFFNTKDNDGKARFNRVHYDTVNGLTKIAQSGNMSEVNYYIDTFMRGLSNDEKEQLKSTIADKVERARLANATLNDARSNSDTVDKEMERLLGRKFKGRKDRRQLMRAAEGEIRARKRAMAVDANATQSNIENINDFSKFYAKKTESIIQYLSNTNEYLHKLIDPSYDLEIANIEDGSGNNSGLLALPPRNTGDGKEAHEARQEAIEEEREEEEQLEADKKSASALDTIRNFLVGKKEKPDEKEGALSKILKGITKVGGFLGIAGLSLTGVSLFGHASEWFRTSIWPKIKGALFGDKTKDEPGLISRFNDMFGGILTKAGTWISEKITSVANWFSSKGGFKGIFLNDIVPGFINGLTYAVNNLVAPTTSLLLKALPSLLIGLSKALIMGIAKAAGWNKVIGSRSKISLNDGGASDKISEFQDGINATLESSDTTGTVSSIKNSFSGLTAAIKGVGNEIDLNALLNDKNDKPSNSALKILGQTKRTNEVEFDKDGNVITDYVTYNTTDSVMSKTAKVSNRAFLKGLGGAYKVAKKATGVAEAAARGTAKFMTPGKLKKLGGLKDFLVAGAKAGKNVINSSGKLGQVANKAIMDTAMDVATSDVTKKGIKSIFTNIANSKTGKWIAEKASKFLSKEVTEKVVNEAIEKIGSKLGEKLLASATKKSLRAIGNVLAKFSPLTIATFVIDFLWGYDNAYTIFGVPIGTYNLTIAHKCVAGLVNLITNFFTLGIISASTIIDIVIDCIFPVFGLTAKKLNEARDGENVQAVLDEWNKNNPDETYDNLQDYNNKDKWWIKWFKNNGQSTNNYYANSTYAANYRGTTTKPSASTGYNPGSSYLTGGSRNSHIYQSDRSIANMRYGNSTIGEAGCAPVAATNLLNGLNHNSSITDAARYAERRGMTAPGGTDIGYFNSYLGSKGISTVNSSNRGTVLNALREGNQVVMLGMDKSNPNGPFGMTPHYITAKGISKNGNIIAEDPDLPNSSVVYRAKDVMNSMMSSVIAKTGKRRNRRFGSARNGLFVNQVAINDGGSGYSSSYTGNASGSTLGPEAIISIAMSQVGIAEEGTSNKIKYCRAYYGNNTGAAWCCIFVWWVFNQAGASRIFGTKTAYCPTLMNYFKNKGRLDMNPQVGDIVFFNFSGGNNAKHVGIIIGINDDGTISTIEGNTGASNNTNGGQVMQRTRKMNTVVGCAHPEYPYKYDSASVIDMSKYGDSTDYESMALSGNANIANSSGTLLTSLSNLGSSMVKAMYGKDAYEALFGSTSSNASATDNGNIGKSIWNYLTDKGYSRAGTAGIMGNLFAESGLNPSNIQNTYEKKLGSDTVYTGKINNKSYSKSKFMNDSAGYGLAQWTYKSRKKGLYESTIEKGKSINDLTGQLDYLIHELGTDYASLNNRLKSTSSINDASDRMLLDFEKPKNASSKKEERRNYSNNMLSKYGSGRNRFVGGNATRALNEFRTISSTTPSTTRYNVSTVSTPVDYQTFLQTIVTILLTIADNTALLSKILEVLSSNLNIDKKEIANAVKSTESNARKRISDILSRSINGTNYGKSVNDDYTNYLVAAMTAIAKE